MHIIQGGLGCFSIGEIVGFFAMAVTTTCVHLVGAPIRVCAVHEVLHGGTTARPIESTSVAGYMRGGGLPPAVEASSECHQS